MKNSTIYEDLNLIFARAQRTFIFLIALFVILVLYFWKVQILDYQEYWKKSEANRIRETILPYQRGFITDRNSAILAKNVGSFKASIIRENSKDFEESCRNISSLLNLDRNVLEERVNKYRSLPDFVPIVIKDNLSKIEVSRIEGRRLELPELVIQAEPKRLYPFGSLAAHIIGYLLELSPEELKTDQYKDKRLGDLVGKTGVERVYESQLKGIEGQLLEIVDNVGRRMGELARREPLPGQNIQLTLDSDLQKKAEELLQEKEGAIVVLDPKTGDVLALTSYPTFDPNKFINRFTPEEWQEIVDDPEFPLENRATRGLYSPGSLFKLVMGLGGLDSHAITDRTTYFCNGAVRIYRQPFSCWKAQGHGAMNLYSAIEHSCNIYFYQLGKKMGIDKIAHYARVLGLGQKTRIDLPGEKEGLVPDPEWKEKNRNAPWYPGETISVSIGQGPLMVTPLQIAAHTAIIANRGTKIIPHLVKSNGRISSLSYLNGQFNQENDTGIESIVFEKVIEGMWLSVNGKGTGRGAQIKGYDVCGKTGSAQLISSEQAKKLAQQKIEVKTHSWFTGFAPRNDPKIVVTVIVEYGGGGGETAAPLARNLFDLFRERYDR